MARTCCALLTCGVDPLELMFQADAQHFVVKTEKLLRQAGLVSSGAEAARKIKERAVSLNGTVVDEIAISISPDKPITVRMGRRVKRVIPVLP